jgi:hypothetical protein
VQTERQFLLSLPPAMAETFGHSDRYRFPEWLSGNFQFNIGYHQTSAPETGYFNSQQ